MKIKYESLRSGDIVFTGGHSPLAAAIRFVTHGSVRGASSTPTHVGIIIDFHDQKLLAEMQADGLRISSLEEYLESRRKFIVAIGRIHSMTKSRSISVCRMIALDRRKTIEYDFAGIASFVSGIEDSDKKYYCSEYVISLLIRAGINIICKNDEKYSPYDIIKMFDDPYFGNLIDWKAE